MAVLLDRSCETLETGVDHLAAPFHQPVREEQQQARRLELRLPVPVGRLGSARERPPLRRVEVAGRAAVKDEWWQMAGGAPVDRAVRLEQEIEKRRSGRVGKA